MTQPAPIFHGDVVDGKLKMADRERRAMAEHVKTLENGTHLDITVKKHKSQRSNQQLRYYFGVIVKMLADHTGYTKDEMHDELKAMFNKVPSKIRAGEWIVKSTSELPTDKFETYEEEIRRWALITFNLPIPLPNEVDF
jgi:hypothetical protein